MSYWKDIHSCVGVVLYEPFGGLCAGLEMCLQAGVLVSCYRYSDTNPDCRKVACHRVLALQAGFPHLLPSSALLGMFCLGHDIKSVSNAALTAVWESFPHTQWLIVAGFECQDMSSAGSGMGLSGYRSGTYFHLRRVLQYLHETSPSTQPASTTPSWATS